MAEWEARVERELRHHPRKLARFHYNEPRHSIVALATIGPPLKQRMEDRLAALEQIIQGTR